MSTTFTATPASELKRRDYLGTHLEYVVRAPIPCEVHRGGLYFEVVSDDGQAHSDICCDPNTKFVVRTHKEEA